MLASFFKMKVVVVIVAVLLTLTTVFVDSRQTIKKHQRHHKNSKKKTSIPHQKQGTKRHFYQDPYDDFQCCQGLTPPPCCSDHLSYPPPPVYGDPYHGADIAPVVPPCCQSLFPPPCCSLIGPDYMVPPSGCCDTDFYPPPCCTSVGLKTGQQAKLPVPGHAGQMILHLRLEHSKQNASRGNNTQSNRKGSSEVTMCQKIALGVHNKKRQIHDVPSMVLDNGLNQKATDHAEKLKTQQDSMQDDFDDDDIDDDDDVDDDDDDNGGGGSGDNDDYNDGEPDGMNYGKICTKKQYSEHKVCKKIVKKWYKEVKSYKFKSPKHKEKNKHFIQMVWKSSTKLGISLVTYKNENKNCYILAAAYSQPAARSYEALKANVKKGTYKKKSRGFLSKIGRKLKFKVARKIIGR